MSASQSNVPEGWQEVKVGDIAKVGRGRVISHKEIQDNPGPYPVYSSQTTNNGEMGRLGSFDFEGDYLTWTTDGANAGTVFQRSGRFNCTNVCGTLKIAPNYDFRFIGFQLSNVAKQYVSSQLANPKLMNGVMAEIALLLPPLPEQKKIAAILSAWDDSIATLTKLLAAKQQQKRGLAEELLTGKRRLKGFAGEWEEKKLGEVLRESRIPAEDKIGKRLTVSLHLRGVSIREERDNSEVGKTIYYQRKSGQFIYGKQNIFRGSLGIVPQELDGYLSSQDLPAFDIVTGFDARFIYEYFARPYFYEGLEQISTGTGSKRVHPEAIYKIHVLFPPLSEQQAIASILSTLDDEILALTRLKAALQQQKRGLMDVLLTGRVRVPVSADL